MQIVDVKATRYTEATDHVDIGVRYEVYGHLEFGNISRISVAHLYNLRRSNTYRVMTRRFSKTKPIVSRIGERAKPDPKGQPGYIRVDTVHQGEL